MNKFTAAHIDADVIDAAVIIGIEKYEVAFAQILLAYGKALTLLVFRSPFQIHSGFAVDKLSKRGAVEDETVWVPGTKIVADPASVTHGKLYNPVCLG